MQQIPPKTIPTLFKESMESNVFEEIIIVLKEEFIPHKKNIFDYLEQLSNVQRFRTLIMFVERKTKEGLFRFYQIKCFLYEITAFVLMFFLLLSFYY